MTTYYHGTSGELTIHAGLCLTSDRDSASHYGPNVYEIEIDRESLKVERLWLSHEELRQMYDDNEYPCDRDADREAMVSAGIDAIVFDDSDPHGQDHMTLRLLSPAAVAAARIV